MLGTDFLFPTSFSQKRGRKSMKIRHIRIMDTDRRPQPIPSPKLDFFEFSLNKTLRSFELSNSPGAYASFPGTYGMSLKNVRKRFLILDLIFSKMRSLIENRRATSFLYPSMLQETILLFPKKFVL